MDFAITSPANLIELRSTLKTLQKKPFRFGAGYTDLLMELRKSQPKNLTVINLAAIRDSRFTQLKTTAKVVQAGAMVTAQQLVWNADMGRRYPVLQQAAHNLASAQIRHVATLGGNLCTASPSGDMACAAVALQATCEIMNTECKKRMVPISEFFTGVRSTCMKKNEFLYVVHIPRNPAQMSSLLSGFIKVGTRKAMECSVVSLAYHLPCKKDGTILQAGIAIGASAPTIRFAGKAADFICGKNIHTLTESDKEKFASLVLSYASPISDIRATAWYRKEVLYNISKSIFE